MTVIGIDAGGLVLGLVMVGLPFVLSGVMGVVAAFLYGMEDKTVAGLVGFLLGFVALAVVAVVFALDVKFGGMAVVNKDWAIIMVFCSGCALACGLGFLAVKWMASRRHGTENRRGR